MSRLKDLRNARRFTQLKMQMLTGIDQSDYSKIETGRRGMSFEQCKRIALALNTSMDYLAGLTDDPAPIPEAANKPLQSPGYSGASFCTCIPSGKRV